MKQDNRNEIDFYKDQIQVINNIHYNFDKYKKKPKKSKKKIQNNNKYSKKQNNFNGGSHNIIYIYLNKTKELKNYTIMLNSINLVKDLGNEPPNILNPVEYIKRIRDIFKPYQNNIKLNILGEKKLKKMGLNSLLSVSNGSKYPGFLLKLILKVIKIKKKSH